LSVGSVNWRIERRQIQQTCNAPTCIILVGPSRNCIHSDTMPSILVPVISRGMSALSNSRGEDRFVRLFHDLLQFTSYVSGIIYCHIANSYKGYTSVWNDTAMAYLTVLFPYSK
jgi:hypothetical protein